MSVSQVTSVKQGVYNSYCGKNSVLRQMQLAALQAALIRTIKPLLGRVPTFVVTNGAELLKADLVVSVHPGPELFIITKEDINKRTKISSSR